MATAEKLLTAEEYRLLDDNGQATELVQGRIVVMNLPAPRHGLICANIVWILGSFVRRSRLGRVMSNDSGVVTQHDPDSVRGPDVCFYSYSRLPRGRLPQTYLSAIPELIFEVPSPSDSMAAVLAKVAEYLAAGVTVVCVVDPAAETIAVHEAGCPPRTLSGDEELTLPAVLTGFRVRLGEFFE